MISLCIPTYNRSEMVIESFSQVIDNELISEIIIVDDFSKDEVFQDLKNRLDFLGNNKIKVFRNTYNKKAFLNKLDCVKLATNEWIILLDSDNILINDYLESIPKKLDRNTFYLPCHAICDSPFLNYTSFTFEVIDKEKYKTLSKSLDPVVQCLLNTGNYLINRSTYIDSIQNEKDLLDCYALDPFYQIFLGFKNIEDFKLQIVENMKYYHRLHKDNMIESGSYYIENSTKSQEFSIYIRNKIAEI